MIIKVYRADGSPDVRNWLVQCDSHDCDATAPMLGSADWLITAVPQTPIYCPWCTYNQAYDLITGVVRCPRCEAIELCFWDPDESRYDYYGPHYASCLRCDAVLIVTPNRDFCGWVLP
ncbi:hypothetical protein OHA25_27355 [Nonomuraea sp. NBC_00507]|uniref:hypothetical protein n=1 Tax=Nonomuraea sp. NBC_00507 TaxID=2976002 RepID=UPI002E1796E4